MGLCFGPLLVDHEIGPQISRSLDQKPSYPKTVGRSCEPFTRITFSVLSYILKKKVVKKREVQ